MSRLKKILSHLPAWTLSILALALMCWRTLAPHPLPESTPSFSGADLLAHGLMFGGITFCFLLDHQRRREWHPLSLIYILWCIVAATAIGIIVEYAQLWMELGRSFDVRDMEADGAGSLLCGLLWYFLQPRWSEKEVKTVSDEKPEADEEKQPEPEKKKPRFRHQIKSAWIRIPLKVILGILIFLILLPVLVYIPPVQTLLKDVACSVLKSKSGMDVTIDKFRIRFPLDVSLSGVSVLTAPKDTMVTASEMIANVKLLPLLKSDVQVNELKLVDGYYRMVAPDTSMIMKIRAGLLDVSPGTSFDLKTMNLNLDKATLKNGRISLLMDVWKKEPNPDTTQTQMIIKARQLDLENINFGMSMLPTIDTLNLDVKRLQLKNGLIDLTNSKITASYVGGDTGTVKYIQPTAEYIASHPAPVDTISPPSPPMTIAMDSIALTNFNVLYATKGVKPANGFDPAYISLTGLNIGLRDFYNQASTIRLPITMLAGKERSGITITSGSGTVAVDETGINLSQLSVRTLVSDIFADADVPFALMEMKPQAKMKVLANASLGLSDISAFLPMANTYLKWLPSKAPVTLQLDASGSISDLYVRNITLNVPSTLSLFAKGHAVNATDIKRMDVDLSLDGRLTNPKVADRLLALKGFNIPALSIKGTASAHNQNYAADFDLKTSAGDLAGKGRVSLNAESYQADFKATGINVGEFMPDLGIGRVTASISAKGAGFNPLLRRAHTDTHISVSSIDWKGKTLRDIKADATLGNGNFDITLSSPNTDADLSLTASGRIAGQRYDFDIDGNIRHLDLEALGLMTQMCNGSGDLSASGYFDAGNYHGDIEFSAHSIDWNMPDLYIHLPHGINGRFLAEESLTSIFVDSDRTSLDFNSPTDLKQLIASFTKASESLTSQINKRHLLVDELHNMLPQFEMSVQASGRGLLNQFLQPNGMMIDTVSLSLANKDILSGNVDLLGLNTGSIALDTITLNLKQRESLLDYRAHIGNRPGTLDEFARVDLMGYAGGNRASLSVTQHNLQGEMGYRLGLTAAVSDSLATVHFTPLKATIAYLPWTINADNHIEVNFAAQPIHISADLQAQSKESQICLRTQENTDGNEELYVKLDNIHIQDFLQMNVMAPPVTASVSSEIHLNYDKNRTFNGTGTIDVKDFTYERQPVGNFDLLFDAGLDLNGNTKATASLLIDNQKALSAHCSLETDSVTKSLTPKDIGLTLTRFPLKVANAFLGPQVAQLNGALNGEMAMAGTFTKPLLNGYIACDSVNVFIPMMGSSLKFDNEPITVADNVIAFRDFDILGANDNPLKLTGNVDASNFTNVLLDLALKANNFQLVGNDRRAKSDIYGKLFINLDAAAKGSMSRLNVNAKLTVLNTTDITYNIPDAQAVISQTNSEDVVQFVQFSDTTQVNKEDSVVSAMSMRILADLSINPGTRVTVMLSGNGTDKVDIQPSGNLSYFQNYMGDMRLNGQLNINSGVAQYSLPVMGQKKFNFEQGSFVAWNGEIMNPILNIKAYDELKANVQQGGNSRLINFLISLAVTNNLNAPKITFDLSTDDDLSIQNELQSMSPDQRSTQAMNLLLYGQYTGPGTKANSNLSGNALYSYATSLLNQWAAKNIRGVDLSFGVDQYDKSVNGQTTSTTSYSYQFSKSLFDNRFKIVVGGNYSTDASADENFAQNLISDISFEYMLKQTQNLSMYVRLFRHTGWESILEGEITETGAGFVMKRRLNNLGQLWPFRRRHRNSNILLKDTTDSTATSPIFNTSVK